MDYQRLLLILKENADKNYDDFNKKIINSGVQTLGCRIPFIRKLAKQLTWEQTSDFPTHDYYEVDLLKGIVLSTAKMHFEDKSKLLTEFAQSIENWAVCDCSCVKIPAAERELYFEYFCQLVSDNRQFVCRYGIVNLLSYYLDDEHIESVFESLRSIAIWGEYYVDIAVAWLVATAMAKCRNATVDYMEGEALQVLNVWSYNKALQKMRESYRVSSDDKQWTYGLKRR